MKYLIVLFICLSSSIQLFSQATDTTSDLKKSYLSKSKSQKTTAWILLGTGAAALVTGLIVGGTAVNDYDDFNSGTNQLAAGGGLILLGAAACLTSIPFFVASGKNKRRALSVTTGSQQIMMPVKSGWANNMQPAIKIIVPLGR